MSEPPADTQLSVYVESRLFRIRTVHIVYLVTLLASGLATFGLAGAMPAILVCIFWASIFTSRSRPQALAYACLVTLLGLCLLGLLLPAVQAARGPVRRMQCRNNLKQIGLALHSYHDTYGTFPPAFIADENGKPMHSWRVLILPFIEQQPLHDKYNFDEPWNGPNNSKLLNIRPPVYACPGADSKANGLSASTSYLAVVGPTTAWPGQAGRTFAEITDGTASTILIVELDNQNIPWLAPRDLNLDEALDLLVSGDQVKSGSHGSGDFFYDRYYIGRNVTFADTSVHFIGPGLSRKTWSAFLGVDDAIELSDNDLEAPAQIVQKLKVENCIKLGIFIVLALFPLPWVWLNPTSGIPADKKLTADQVKAAPAYPVTDDDVESSSDSNGTS